MKRKVYIETSVISYLTARPSRNVIEAGHQQSTYLFWDKRDEFDLFADALHISIATVHSSDYLLTWNCRHIANPEIQVKIAEKFNDKGLLLPFICTPEELIGGENE